MKRGLGVLLTLLIVLTIIPQITFKAKAANGVEEFVKRCYYVAFQREADQGGLNYWKNEIDSKKRTGVDVVYNFIFSQEYESQKTSDKQFVKDLYTMFMGREPDQNGYDYWCGQMAEGKSRNDIFTGFANSPEFYNTCNSYGITSGYYTDEIPLEQLSQINLFVARMYETTLGRTGDQGGQKYWVEGLASGELTGIGCAVNFIKSKEFESQELSQDEYLDVCYKAFMGRESDDAGKEYWMKQMKSGNMSRDQVFEGFAKSNEFQTICSDYNIQSGDYTATNTDDNHKYDDIPSKKDDDKKTEDTNDDDKTEDVVREERVPDASGGGYSIKKYKNDVLVSWVNYYSNGDKYYDTVLDDKGVVTKTTYYTHSGKIDHYTTHTYFKNGIQKQCVEYSANGKKVAVYDYFENGAKRVQFETKYLENGYKSVFEYNADEKRIKETYYTDKGVITSTREYTYDSKGRCTADKSYYGNGQSPAAWTLYEYYGNGQTKTMTYLMGGYLQYLYEYNSNGILTRLTNNTKMSSRYKTVTEFYLTGDTKKVTYIADSGNTIGYDEWYENGNYKRHTYFDDGSVIYIVECDENGKMETATYYDASGNKTFISEFNENGETEKTTNYDASGNITGVYEFEYYENGEKKKTIKKDSLGNAIGYDEWYENGYTKRQTSYIGGSVNYIVECDENGNKKKWTQYDASGNKTSISEYDENGKTEKTTFYDASGNITYVYEYEYYENGESKKTIKKDSLGNTIGYDEWYENETIKRKTEYDDDGNVKNIAEFNENGKTEKTTNYDASGNITDVYEYEYYENGRDKKETKKDPSGNVIGYDEWYENGNIKRKTNYYDDGSVYCVYEYDENGNAI